MLNELDARLARDENDAKIVFIMYIDTLWPPVSEKLNNPSRFIVTTACYPITRYGSERYEGGIPEWRFNDYRIAGGLDMALSFKDGWKPIFDGKSFIYEYTFYTDQYADPGHMLLARQVAENMKTLPVTGFDGIMSDQTQRSFFPTGLPLSIFGEFLFDSSLDTSEYIDKYAQDAFGDDWYQAKVYLEKISACFDPDAMRQNTNVTAQDLGTVDVNSRKAGIIGNRIAGDVILEVPNIVRGFSSVIKQNLTLSDECRRESWKILEYHGEYCIGVAEVFFLLSRNEIEKAQSTYDKLLGRLSEIEEYIHPYFDLCLFNQRTKQVIAGK
jgi:hypothetical protein